MTAARKRMLGRLAAPLLPALLVFCLAAVSARAASWGERSHFALPVGTGAGQVNPSGGSGELEFSAGTDGSYYVVDRVAGEELRLQRFAGRSTQGSISFEPPQPTNEEGGEASRVLVASDPAHNRVYVLSVYTRREKNEKEEKQEEKTGKPVFPLDAEMQAAGALYAFEYKPGTGLVSAKEKEGKPAPVLTRAQMGGQAEAPKEALLDPRGMAVDPATGNLVIVGNEDEEADEKVEAGKLKQCRPAAQFVAPEANGGQLKGAKLGRREVDRAAAMLTKNGRPLGCGEEEAEEAGLQAPLAPVFAPGEKLLVLYYEGVGAAGNALGAQVWEFASDSGSQTQEEVVTTPQSCSTPKRSNRRSNSRRVDKKKKKAEG